MLALWLLVAIFVTMILALSPSVVVFVAMFPAGIIMAKCVTDTQRLEVYLSQENSQQKEMGFCERANSRL